MNQTLVEQLLERIAELVGGALGQWVVLEDTDGFRVEGYVTAVGHDADGYWVQLDDDELIAVTPADLAVMLRREPGVETRATGRPRPVPRSVVEVQLPDVEV